MNLMKNNLAKCLKIKLEAILKITFPRIKFRISNIMKLVKSEMTKLKKPTEKEQRFEENIVMINNNIFLFMNYILNSY